MHTRWLLALLLLGLVLCLGGCDLGRSAPPTPLPTAAPSVVEPGRSSSGGVAASGEIPYIETHRLEMDILPKRLRVFALGAGGVCYEQRSGQGT